MLAKAAAVVAMAAVAILVATPASEGPRPAAAQTTVNHAAVVIDTGDGQVRKMCLTFSEAELDGIEVLRRVDTRPYRFEAFGSKGAGVCMLCGVGCASGNCFCDPQKYWAYHRAGPGGEAYQASRVGASSTRVRNGDVEGWRWGTGAPPPAATVSEVCGVEEPPRRTASATTTTAATASTTAESPGPTTTVAAEATTQPPTPPASSAPPRTGGGGGAATTAPLGAGASSTSTPSITPSTELSTEPAPPADEPAAAAPSQRTLAASSREADDRNEATSKLNVVGLVVFVGLLGGLLVWRARLRRAKTA